MALCFPPNREVKLGGNFNFRCVDRQTLGFIGSDVDPDPDFVSKSGAIGIKK